MRDKIERIIIKYGGLNLWSPKVRESLIDDLDKELNFSNSSQISVDSKRENNTNINNEESPGNTNVPNTPKTPVNEAQKNKSKKIKRNKKSTPVRRSSNKPRTKSRNDGRNVEEIEMLPKTQ